MKERPILFKAEMVRAILDGTKTMTRREIRPQPKKTWMENGDLVDICDTFLEFGKVFSTIAEKWRNYYQSWVYDGVQHHRKRWWIKHPDKFEEIYCPYGEPGDRLWVKETWRTSEILDGTKPKDLQSGFICEFAAGGNSVNAEVLHGMSKKWRSPLFMQKRFSRITLEITNIRVERLNDISYSDAMAEGWQSSVDALDPLTWFKFLWEKINGNGSWKANQWVWVVEFKVIKP